ncbi:MAG TPA: hypothetical protein ENK49_09095, partial [Gammaproteobacteria bacterium]|nr:hypothetical protein [Gammaproteobacteria bacterium]
MSSADRNSAGGPDPGLHPPLRPPGQQPASPARGAPGRRRVGIALAVVLLLGLLVVLVLPRLVPVPTGVDDAVVGKAPSAAGSAAPAARAAAEQGLQQYLQLQARLELDRAPVWGAPLWEEAAVLAANGDRRFGERRFAAAARSYGDALQRLQQLEDRKPQIFTKALDAGLVALEENQPDSAQQQLELALAIDPQHEVAVHALARAEVRRRVLAQVAAGETAERNEDLEAAAAGYTAALELDSEYQPARDRLQRVTAQLADRRFRDAMSQALGALDEGRLDAAGRALETAAQIRPESTAVRDARLRLVQARQQTELSRLRGRAEAAVRDEDWQAAAGWYRKALQVDAEAGFARNGLQQSEARLQLHRQFDRYLEAPQRLYSEQPLANAEKLLKAAGTAPATEPRLANKIQKLAQLVTAARVPVQVRLRSDGETEVVVYHVARLGRFVERQLAL